MKYILSIVIFALAFALHAEKEVKIKSEAQSVTVYLNGAQINRTAKSTIPKGKSTIIIEGITPVLVKESIQVKGIGNFTILAINNRLAYKEKKQDLLIDVKKLNARKVVLTELIEDETALLNILQEQEKLFETNKKITDNQQEIRATELKAMMELHLSNIKQAKLDALKHIRTVNKYKLELNNISNQLKAAQLVEQEVSTEIHIQVFSSQSTSAQFNLSYLTPNAKWFPSYDVIAKSIDKPVQLNYKANISQQTGEDWSNVKLTLSTNNPNRNANKPLINPWYISLNRNNSTNNYTRKTNRTSLANFTKVSGKITDYATGEALPFVNIQVKNSTIGTTTDFDGHYELTLPSNGQQLIVSFIGYEKQTLPIRSQNMDIKLKESDIKLDEFIIISHDTPLIDKDREKAKSDSKSVASVRGARFAECSVYIDGIKVNANSIAKMPSKSVNSMSASVSAVGGIGTSRVKGFRMFSKRNQTPRAISNPITITPVQNVVNKQFKIEAPVSIPSDIKSYTVEINQITTASTYEHYCAPKIDPSVFLTANITNWEQHNLLEGQANIYFEDTYIGNSLLNVGVLSDTLTLSLGKDKSIYVTRNKIKDFTKQKLIGGNKVDSRSFTIEVRNNKTSNINLILEDQIPISTNAKIEIDSDIDKLGKLDKEKGIITWEVAIAPKENKKLSFNYDTKYPKQNWIGLE